MKKNSFFGRFLLPSLLMLLSISCKKELRNDTAEETLVSTPHRTDVDKSAAFGVGVGRTADAELLQSVRAATAKFQSTAQAIKAGYEPTDECVSVPGLGGMGYHWVNPSLVNPGFDPLKPEVVLYAKGSDGELRLVALEYIVVNVGQLPPMFGSQPFMVGGTPLPIPHWSLHVWLYEPNPSGMFMPFNPNISCL